MSDSYPLSERSNGLGFTNSVNKCIGSVKTLLNVYHSIGCKNVKCLSVYQNRSQIQNTRKIRGFKITTGLLNGLDTLLT